MFILWLLEGAYTALLALIQEQGNQQCICTARTEGPQKWLPTHSWQAGRQAADGAPHHSCSSIVGPMSFLQGIFKVFESSLTVLQCSLFPHLLFFFMWHKIPNLFLIAFCLNNLLRYNSQYHTFKVFHLKCSIHYTHTVVPLLPLFKFRTFLFLLKETLYLLWVILYSAYPHPCHPQPQTITNILSVSVDLPILDISYKWNDVICGIYE